MSRLVEATGPADVSLTARPALTGSDYAERTAKYVPGEVVAVYVSLNGILDAVDPSDRLRVPVSWLVFVLCLVATPLYLNLLGRREERPWLHMGISTVAFVIWGYALGGPFQLIGVHKAWLGSVLLGVFTLVVGLVKPKRKRR